MRKWFSCHHAGIVDQKFHREVIGAIDHKIVIFDDIEGIGCREEFLVSNYLNVGIQLVDFLFG